MVFLLLSFQYQFKDKYFDAANLMGKAKQSVFFSIFRKVIIVIPMIFILPHIGGLGVNGIFMAEPISNFIGGLACYGTMMATIWPSLTKKQKEKLK